MDIRKLSVKGFNFEIHIEPPSQTSLYFVTSPTHKGFMISEHSLDRIELKATSAMLELMKATVDSALGLPDVPLVTENSNGEG